MTPDSLTAARARAATARPSVAELRRIEADATLADVARNDPAPWFIDRRLVGADLRATAARLRGTRIR